MVPFQHPVVWSHHAGWFYQDGKKGFFYGTGVLADYSGVIPEGFEVCDIPGSYYLVFGHPMFDYLKHNSEVMKRVEILAWGFDPRIIGTPGTKAVVRIIKDIYLNIGVIKF